MIKEYDLKKEIEETAKLISQFSNNPITWLSWVTYFLDSLQDEALNMNPTYQERYEDMLSMLQDAIHNRRRTGGW